MLIANSLINKINKSNNNEIASHTFSHFYCNENGVNDEDFRNDILSALKIANFNNIIVKGTTIKSAFVDYFLSKKILFFTDDDKKKIGQKFNSKKIFSFSKNMINKKDMYLIDTTKDFI